MEEISDSQAWPETASNRQPGSSPRIALVLGGGGARAAYQAGVLCAIGNLYPQYRFPFLAGVSAGAINISLLANHPGALKVQSDTLAGLWRKLRIDDVFTTEGASLLWRAFRIATQLAIGPPPGLRSLYGMVDTSPLRQFLKEALGTSDGTLPGIRANIEKGHLEAVALTTLSYGTGYTVTFYQGQYRGRWDQPRRRSIDTPLTVEHVMASAALPLFFPPIQIDGDWYGDGGIRLVNPLAPALHTGANKVLAISNHYLGEEPHPLPQREPPSPATVMSSLYDAIFLDQLDQDVLEMQMINKLVKEIPPEKRHGMREIELLVIRPSADIGAMAYELRQELPPTLKFLMSRIGAGDVRSQDFLSTVLFQERFVNKLIELGIRDGEAHRAELVRFFES